MQTFEKASRVLGALEERMMELLWRKSPLSVRDVGDRLRGGPRLAYTTVMTTLDRLYKKGLLARDREGAAFIYRPAFSRDEYHRRVVEAAFTGLVAKATDPVLAAFVDVAASVDEANLQRLEDLIAQRRKARR
jgi:predicted transcriptional regulator